MVQTKKMNEEFFARLHKEITTTGELIRARQNEKQGLLDDFASESKRFFFGKISEKALASSVKKTNKELNRLDSNIRVAISKTKKLSDNVKVLVGKQAPIGFKATLSGTSGGKSKAKKVKKVKKVKKAKKKAKKKSKKK